MSFSYKPLWRLLADENMSKAELCRRIRISSSTMNRMRHNGYVGLEILDAICTELDCTPNDVIEHIKE